MTIFKINYQDNHKIINLMGIKIKIDNSFYKKVNRKFKKNKNFDCRKFDNEIAQITEKNIKNYQFRKNPINNNRIAILATLFYDMGGHTECVKNLVSVLSKEYNITTFLTKKNITYEEAPNKIKLIEKYSKINGVNSDYEKSDYENLIDIFEKINDFSPKVLFVYMHMDDCLSAALLFLLKKYTDIKIIYINHGSHYPALGMTFAHAVSYSFDSILKVNKEWRKIDNNIYLNLIDDKREDIFDISQGRKNEIRNQLGIKEDEYFTLSGASSYKFFENDKSLYFEMIKRLLEREPKLHHVIITKLLDREKEVVDNIFKESTIKDRLKIIDFTPNYSEIFQSCDLFIDSFPVGSALTHVELMKHKKVSVVYKNEKNILFNFYEYFPKDYKYIFSNDKEMEENILELLYKPVLREELGNDLYKHFLNAFEGYNSIKLYKDTIHKERYN